MVRGRWIKVSCYIEAASHLLKTNFTTVKRGVDELRPLASSFELPAEVAQHVSAVYGLHGVPVTPRSKVANASNPRNEGTPGGVARSQANGPYGPPPDVTPALLSQLYNVSKVPAAPPGINKQAIVGFLGQTCSKDDLKAFFKMYVLIIVHASFFLS